MVWGTGLPCWPGRPARFFCEGPRAPVMQNRNLGCATTDKYHNDRQLPIPKQMFPRFSRLRNKDA